MKTHRKPLAPGQNKLKSRRGVALITVLTIISLCTILVLTFFQLAQNEMVSSDSYNNGIEAQQIAEEAVNLVIRQIREATADDSSSGRVGWASQPGAIRNWGQNGKFLRAMKLYSDDEMEVDVETDLVENDFSDLNDWDTKPWQFVDLNEPVIRGQKVYYPIVDPAARDYPKWKTPLGNDKTGIEGFDYHLNGVSPGPMEKAVHAIRQRTEQDGTIVRETLPMPVKWLYQLKDGTLGVLDNSQKFKTVSGGSQPSEINPIVARMAFWADDETTKLNPNIHAGGAAWNTPMASGMIDRESFARFQPTQHEWQRYPGHPATTHLAPVLAPGITDITYNRDAMEILFGLVPRVVGGGSLSGTRKVDMNDPRERNGLIADKDRLYATLDEFMLEPGRVRNKPTRSDRIREPNNFPDPQGRSGAVLEAEVVQEQMERSKFFLSVVSRAPETTVFNTPRISIWPTQFDETLAGADYVFDERQHTPFDKLIRFCAEIGKGPSGKSFQYHFQRMNADSTSLDLPSSTGDQGIHRNRELMFYLEKLTRTKIPGIGNSFEDKYGKEERLQILTEIFDYIRSTNLHDDSIFGENWKEAFQKDNDPTPLTYTNPRKNDEAGRGTHKGHGQVTPIRFDWGSDVVTKGFGRFTTIYEVGTHVICCADAGRGPGQGYKGGYQVAFSYPGVQKYKATDSWEWHEVPVEPERPSVKNPLLHYSNFPPIPQGVPFAAPIAAGDVGAEITRQASFIVVDPMTGQVKPNYSIPYAERAKTWVPFPEWLRKMAEPQYLRDPDDFGTGDDNKNPEYDPLQYAPRLVTIALNENYWNWQLAWLDVVYSHAIERIFTDGDPKNNEIDYFKMDGNSAGKRSRRFDRSFLDDASWKAGLTRLAPGEKLVQAALLFQGFCPSLGWGPINPDFEMDIEMKKPMQFRDASGMDVFLPDPIGKTLARDEVGKPDIYRWSSNAIASASHFDRHYGGTRAWTYFLRGSRNLATDNSSGVYDVDFNSVPGSANINFGGRATPIDHTFEKAESFNRYYFVSRPWRIRAVNPTDAKDHGVVEMVDDTLMKIDIYSSGKNSKTQGTAATVDRQLVQTLEIEMKKFKAPGPILSEGDPGYINEFGVKERNAVAPISYWSNSGDGVNPLRSTAGRLSISDSHRLLSVRASRENDKWRYTDVLKSVGVAHGDARIAAALAVVPKEVFAPRPGYDKDEVSFAHTFATTTGHSLPYANVDPSAASPIKPTAVERQLIPDKNVVYSPRPLGTGTLAASKVQYFSDFDNGFGLTIDGPYINKADEGNTHSLFNRTDPNSIPTGAFDMARDYGDFPYFVRDWIHEPGSPAYFSPNRIMSSPVQFGSLTVGSFRDANNWERRPWRTLLFRPDVGFNPAIAADAETAGTQNGKIVYHPGALAPADHNLLDLFWMPMVEPYAISEPLSTGGKVNLNYQILPFRHVTRNTALRGVFKSEYMLMIPNKWGQDYKSGVGRGRGYHWRDRPFGGNLQSKSLRSIILEDPTLAQFETKFNQEKTIFRTASEICEIHLVPQEIAERTKAGGASASIESETPTVEEMRKGEFWAKHALVGDNSREKPYSDIYPRVTTKSNTFKVHYRAQVLKKAKGTDPAKWDSLSDQVVGEYRGSSIVERYVDPNDSKIPDYAVEIGNDPSSAIHADTIDKFYKFRVIQPTRFAP